MYMLQRLVGFGCQVIWCLLKIGEASSVLNPYTPPFGGDNVIDVWFYWHHLKLWHHIQPFLEYIDRWPAILE
jgi:hypothetical protein